MNKEKPKSIWKKSLPLPGSFLGWLVLVTCLALAISFFGAWIIDGTHWMNDFDVIWIVTVISVVAASLFLFIRWLCCWRNFKRFLFGLACFITLIALFFAEENWRGKHDWGKFKREEAAKGEKFDFKDFIPPPVPDDQNFALTPVVASSYNYILTRDGEKIPGDKRDTKLVNRLIFDLGDRDLRTNGLGYWASGTVSDLKPWQDLYRELATKTNLFAVPPQPQSPAADVLLALSKYDPTVEELRQAGQLPESRFPLNYDAGNPGTILLPDLAAMKSSVLMLRLRAIAELQSGQNEKALDDVKLMFRLTEAIRTEPFLISHLVRIAMTEIILQPIYDGLANHQWTDAQLVELNSELAKLDFLADYKLAMRGELAVQDRCTDFLIRNRRDISAMTFENGASPIPPFIDPFIPTGWFYQNQLNCARVMVKFYIPLADVNRKTVSPSAARRAGEVLQTETKKITPYNILERLVIPALGNAVKKFAFEQSSVDLARTAIALERYRLAHGEFPESLDALAPKFISEVPHDVIGGGPLKYRREPDGEFVLYSGGWNERDDGGVTGHRNGGSAPDFESGDWVWRYPEK